MIAALATAAWSLLSLVAFRPLFRWMNPASDRVEWVDVLLGGFIMLYLAALIGPFVVLGQLARRVADARGLQPEHVARAIGGESRADKIDRLEQEAEERQRRIAQLERDLGIDQEAAA